MGRGGGSFQSPKRASFNMKVIEKSSSISKLRGCFPPPPPLLFFLCEGTIIFHGIKNLQNTLNKQKA
jgi:hypothetical protein